MRLELRAGEGRRLGLWEFACSPRGPSPYPRKNAAMSCSCVCKFSCPVPAPSGFGPLGLVYPARARHIVSGGRETRQSIRKLRNLLLKLTVLRSFPVLISSTQLPGARVQGGAVVFWLSSAEPLIELQAVGPPAWTLDSRWLAPLRPSPPLAGLWLSNGPFVSESGVTTSEARPGSPQKHRTAGPL